MKQCEICKKEIPEDYQNLLCDEHYKELEEKKSEPVVVADATYKTNPQMEDKEQIGTNLSLFMSQGVLLWKPTKTMYQFIRDFCIEKVTSNPTWPKFVFQPFIVDVGCGSGVGTNILSEQGSVTFGFDKNAKSIQFAKEAFTRHKNNIYYSPQVTFECIDIMEDNREFQKCDVIVAIEVLEHIAEGQKFIDNLVLKFGQPGSDYFISTPNRNNKSLSQTGPPKNKYHCIEYTSKEFVTLLKKTFSEVTLYNSAGVPIPKEEYDTTTHTPLLGHAKV